MASYVLSRTYGNYVGLYNQDFSTAFPNAGPQFDFSDIMVNTTGLLPNDRTHALKMVGSYRTSFGLTCGVWFLWTTGTPLNIFGASSHGPSWPILLVPRGTAGRLPSIWDLSVRLSYDVPSQTLSGIRPRLILDVYHIASPSIVVQQDQTKYLAVDAQGNQADPNPAYGSPMRFQPPMSMRLGLEVNF